MRFAAKIFGGLVLILLIALGSGYFYLVTAFPKVSPAEKITIEPTGQRLARGKYLAENACDCFGCHSNHDFQSFGIPVKPETRGQGGFLFDHKLMGLPGDIYSRNITPYHLGDWTDGEIVRSLRAGVNKQGEALFPLMPFDDFSALSREDIYSIVAYIRTLKPLSYDPPERRLEFPVNLIVRTLSKDAGPYPPDPDPKDKVAYGHYLMNATGCMHCHTPADPHGAPLPGMDFAGGTEFHFPDGSTVRAANITPDKATGIGEWSKEAFVKRFRLGKKMVDSHLPVKPGEFNSVMPWEGYGGMTEGDLGALYDYLHGQVKPVKNYVEKFTPPGAQTASK
jgi:hypothetical protein